MQDLDNNKDAGAVHAASAIANQRLEMWKYFSGIGGADKDRMVTIATWLLAFSAGIIGYVVTHLDKIGTDARQMGLLAGLGILVSLAASFVVLLYGAYANWNWANADEIAAEMGDAQRRWLQASEQFKSELVKAQKGVGGLEPRWVNKFGAPPESRYHYAPIFRWFFRFAEVSLAVHCAMLLTALVLIQKLAT